MMAFQPFKVPSAAAIARAIAIWQQYCGGSELPVCKTGHCFHCDVVRQLIECRPFLELINSFDQQVIGGDASFVEALSSAFAFGLLTAQLSEERTGYQA